MSSEKSKVLTDWPVRPEDIQTKTTLKDVRALISDYNPDTFRMLFNRITPVRKDIGLLMEAIDSNPFCSDIPDPRQLQATGKSFGEALTENRHNRIRLNFLAYGEQKKKEEYFERKHTLMRFTPVRINWRDNTPVKFRGQKEMITALNEAGIDLMEIHRTVKTVLTQPYIIKAP